jgi:PEP-CTERM motif
VQKRSLLLSALLLILPLPLPADTVYTYTGNDFTQAFAPYTTSESVTGSFTVADPIGPNLAYGPITVESFSFSDGLDIFTNATPLAQEDFYFSTDAAGNFTNWSIFLQSDSHDIYTRGGGLGIGTGDGGVIEIPVNNQDPIADRLGAPGVWTESTDPSPVPEPSSLLLLATGALFLAGLAGRTLADPAL